MNKQGEIVICQSCLFSYDVTKKHVCKARTVREMAKGTVQFHVKSVAGRILTLVDGMLPPGTQCEAFKTLVKKEFREELARVNMYFHDGCGMAEGVSEVAVFEKEL